MANIRYNQIIRFLAALSLDQKPNYADTIDQVLSKVSDDDMLLLFYGDPYEIAHLTRKYNLPVNFIDLMCILIDGERLLPPEIAKELVREPPVPPKKAQH